MILGHLHIDEAKGAVNTHRDSYRLATLSVVSVRRPFLGGGLLAGIGTAAFVAGFADLLYAHESAIVLACGVVAVLAGLQVGQLRLLSRDLRGSDLSEAIWGRHASLNGLRLAIAAAMHRSKDRNSGGPA
ncbi:hypothetical protein [Xanthobacter autotrophicus]|uniref:hypothetical protein n=1 Tax=Xanthobacter autotrophicus TaxID=280 RepID=UPI0037279E87